MGVSSVVHSIGIVNHCLSTSRLWGEMEGEGGGGGGGGGDKGKK